eukprot:CAMPEP_0177413072 /NCGR_PEP_ID=MMETSP0368-20130122/66316_1 /TAXON_ID=447022 ORGANISM="Scrippsiella hangoei-like, Strain SHHI-4" /NCGR_SAMPLE_ID=MMETSP0368 /ASSEMBLY_ACC=CAM_ASM_000363 /LENGTH=82 /DNA_ID=CAMNT_0018882351 /DNA_START=289 /DNA_END=537 /DNA_ORIENTATION=+
MALQRPVRAFDGEVGESTTGPQSSHAFFAAVCKPGLQRTLLADFHDITIQTVVTQARRDPNENIACDEMFVSDGNVKSARQQ